MATVATAYLSHSLQATQYYRLDSLKVSEISFSQFWGLGSPWWSWKQIQCLMMPCFLVGHLFTVSSHGRRDEGGLFYKGTNPIHEGSILMIKSPPRDVCLNTITMGTGFQQMNSGRHKYSVYRTIVLGSRVQNTRITTKSAVEQKWSQHGHRKRWPT